MKIAHLTTAHPPDDNRIFKMCRSIASAGHEVTLVVPTDRNCVVEGVAIKAVPPPSGRLARGFLTTWQVYLRAAQEKADLYQFHDPELIPVGLALRMLHRRKVIYDVHENVPEQILLRSYVPRWLRKWVAAAFDSFERHSANRFSAIVTANEDINERFSGVGERVVSIHNYAEAEEFEAAAVPDPSRYSSGIVYHSGGTEATSLPAVLRALRLLPQSLDLKLIVTSPIFSCAERAGRLLQHACTERVELRGVLPRQEMVKILSRCAVSIVLYADAHNHSSIRSNRFYESLAAGAPVIASDFPEWRATVTSLDCGLCVNPTDPSAIAAALEYLCSHPAEAAAMGKRGQRAFLRRFCWTTEKKRLLRLYGRLMLPAIRGGKVASDTAA